MTEQIKKLEQLTRDDKPYLMNLKLFADIEKIAFFALEGSSQILQGYFERLDGYNSGNLASKNYNVKFFDNGKSIYICNIGIIKNYCKMEEEEERKLKVRFP